MAQLDSFSWLNQVFSVLVVLSAFYLLLSLYYLPFVTHLTKGRFKLMAWRKLVHLFFSLQTNLVNQNQSRLLKSFFGNNVVVINNYALIGVDSIFNCLFTAGAYHKAKAVLQQSLLNKVISTKVVLRFSKACFYDV